jgi:3-oxoacyl-[acyl-carrier protein] reductase
MEELSSVAARPLVLVTGVGRRTGIGAAIAARLALDGWDVAINYWAPYDERMSMSSAADDIDQIADALRATGARTMAVQDDVSDVAAAGRIFDAVETELGPVTAMVLSHCESVDSGLLDTTVESFDAHFAVNARGSWLLIREFANRFRGAAGAGRILALTSDATVGNMPYGASKGALDRIVIAAARELADHGITCNVIDPGPVDTGWISDELRASIVAESPQHRIGQPRDAAALVSFLCSSDGGWVNGQLLHSDGGLHT